VRPVDLAAVVRAALETVRESAEANGIDLTVDLGPGPAVVRGDRHRLQQAVWNLLTNAIKFTPSGGRVRIGLESVPDGLRITVSDTGRGIQPELLGRIFERFRQGEHVARRTQGGLGLGLAIVRHLIELHGGRVGVSSAGEGAGATFTIDLPAAPEAAADQAGRDASTSTPAPNEDASLDGLRVLVIEDERDTARMLVQVLGECGAAVAHVETSSSAVEVLERVDPHVVISDIALPGADGYALMRRIRALPRHGRLPAIALTAFAREEDIQRAIAAGFDVHLAKPIDPAELARAVARVVRGAPR
jgi:CheY-like chemotaxis protein